MELRHLRYFVAVADAGSLTVAAEQKLHTSQPSLSRQIRDLEQEVGVQLIHRSAHGVELTSAGKAFLDHARMALVQAEAAKEAALRAAQPAKPAFALGFMSGAEIGLLPEVDRVLRDEFPGIEIRLSSDYSPVLAKALMRRKLDAAFIRPEEQMEDLGYRRVRTDPLVFVFPRDHRLASQAAIAPQEIWLFNLLMAVVRGTGNLQVPVIVVCGGALIVVPLSPVLIFGAFGYPGLGPSGGAVAMLVYYGLGTLAYAAYLWGGFGVLKPSFRVPRLSLAPALAILSVGGMSAVVSATTNLTLAIVTAYVAMGGVEALAGYGAGSRLEFLLVPLAYGIGGPVGIVISANLGAGQIERAVKASWIGVAMAFALTELIGLAAAVFPEQWIGLFSQDPSVLQVGAEYLHRVGPFFGFFGLGYALYCVGQATRRMEASVFAALLRAAIAVLGGLAVIWLKADVAWNFIAVALGMVAFGLVALPPLISRSGYE